MKNNNIIIKINSLLKYLLVTILPSIGLLNLFELENYKYNSVILLLLMIGNIFIYIHGLKDENKRNKIIYIIFSLFISLFITLGLKIDNNYYMYTYSFKSELGIIMFEIYSLTIIISSLMSILIKLCNKCCFKNEFKHHKKLLVISFIFILLVWGIYLINYYPGLMSPDSLNQWGQGSGAIKLSNHHPILHTLFISIFVNIGKLWSSNIGLLCYNISQIIIMDLIIIYLIKYLLDKKYNIFFIILVVLFYTIIPVFGIYSVTMWKDVLFGAFALLLMIQINKLIEEESLNLINKILLIISIILTSLFRTNGLYAVAAVSIMLLIFLNNKRKSVIKFLIIPTILSFIIVGPVYRSFGIADTEFTENIGIPLKQIYGVLYENKPINKKDFEFLSGLVDKQEALDIYSPYDDHIKSTPSYDNEYLEKNKVQFFKTWISIGLKYPTKYIDIYLKSTYGYWYPEAQGYIVHMWPIWENKFDLNSKENFNNLKANEYFTWFYNTPILKYLTSDAFYFWILLISCMIIIINKKYKKILSLLLPIFIWGTIMIASPLSYQPRYTFALFCVAPLCIVICLETFENYNLRKKLL